MARCENSGEGRCCTLFLMRPSFCPGCFLSREPETVELSWLCKNCGCLFACPSHPAVFDNCRPLDADLIGDLHNSGTKSACRPIRSAAHLSEEKPADVCGEPQTSKKGQRALVDFSPNRNRTQAEDEDKLRPAIPSPDMRCGMPLCCRLG